MKPVAYEHTDSNGQREVSYVNRVDATPLYAIPDGYKLVPIEPTEEMTASRDEWFADIIYEKYIEAAPDIEDLP